MCGLQNVVMLYIERLAKFVALPAAAKRAEKHGVPLVIEPDRDGSRSGQAA